MSGLKFLTAVQRWLMGDRRVPKNPDALRFGLISTALINDVAFHLPADSHPDVVITAVGSRSEKSAAEYAAKWKIPKHYGSYEALLADKDIDAVYIGLPNSMHAEWAQKSLLAGKHVLLEKPFAANAAEARIIANLAKEKNLVLLEAFHYRFHPASNFVENLVRSGKYGNVTSVKTTMSLPKNGINSDDIRFSYDLAGGATMDMTYVISSARLFSNSNHVAVTDVTKVDMRKVPGEERVDESVDAEFMVNIDGQEGGKIAKASVSADLALAPLLWVIPRFWVAPGAWIEMEKASLYFHNYCAPHIYHYITIKDKTTGKSTTQKVFSGSGWGDRGEKWWSTYRYQLEAFVDKVRGREPAYWITNEDSIMQMQSIDAVYEKAGLPLRKGALA